MKTLYYSIMIIIGISGSISLWSWYFLVPDNNIAGSISGIMNVDNTNSSIKFTIVNGTLYHIYKTENKPEVIVLDVNATSNGYLYITIPRLMLDFKNPNGSDGKFSVFEAGQEIDFTEIKKTSTERTLYIPFKKSITFIEVVKPNS